MSEQTVTQPQADNFHDSEAEAIADRAPWPDVSTETTLPNQYWHFHIEDIGTTFSSGQDSEGKPITSKLVIQVELRVLRPTDFEGRMLRLRYTIGNESDPRAEKPATWLTGGSVGASNLKRLGNCVGAQQSWREIKNKNVAFFTETREFQGRKYTQPQGFDHNYYIMSDTTFAPGTPTPSVAGSRRGRMPSATQQQHNGASQASPDTEVECTQGCGRKFLLSQENVLLAHIQQCDGQPQPQP